MGYDVAPGAPALVQPYGCTSYEFEVSDPDCPGGHMHCGVDLAGPDGGSCEGTWVYATRPGVIGQLGAGSVLEGHDLGVYAVRLDLDGGGCLWHGHLGSAVVMPGQRVSQGQALGRIGSLGVSTGPHLHLEYRVAYFDPQDREQVLAGCQDPSEYLYYPASAAVTEVPEMPVEIPFPPLPVPAGLRDPIELASQLNTSLVRAYVRLRSTGAQSCSGTVVAVDTGSGRPLASVELRCAAGGAAQDWHLPDGLDCELVFQPAGDGPGSISYKVGTLAGAPTAT